MPNYADPNIKRAYMRYYMRTYMKKYRMNQKLNPKPVFIPAPFMNAYLSWKRTQTIDLVTFTAQAVEAGNYNESEVRLWVETLNREPLPQKE